MPIDLKFTDDHDLEIVDGDLVLTDEGAEVAQRVKDRILTIKGEWFGDRTYGVPWFDDMFRMATSQANRRKIIYDIIAGTEGVKSVDALVFDQEDHECLIDARITTIYATSESVEI